MSDNGYIHINAQINYDFLVQIAKMCNFAEILIREAL